MKAVKENKVYTVDEISKKDYLAQGYDIVDDDFNVLERSPSATVPYREYEKLIKENAELKAELDELKQKKK
jgi:hypothetical protein